MLIHRLAWGAFFRVVGRLHLAGPALQINNPEATHLLHRSTTRVLLLLCAMYMITYMDRVNVSTGAIGFGKEFHLSNMQIGLVFSAFAYPYLIFQVIGGWVGDRFGPHRSHGDGDPPLQARRHRGGV